MSPAHHMKMQVEDGLTAVPSCIGHKTVARLGQSLVFRNLRTGQQQLPDQGVILRTIPLHRGHMFLGNDQRMYRCLGVDIVEGQGLIVFMHYLGWNLFFYDFAE